MKVSSMNKENKQILIEITRKAIELWVKEGKIYTPELEKLPEFLKEKKGVFVTIYKKHGNEKMLRGCIGFPYPDFPLGLALARAAVEAANDPRFPPLQENELDEITLEISLLSVPKKLELTIEERKRLPELLDKKKGYIIKKGFNSGLFLPQVWEELQDPYEFLANLCFKAGLQADAWMDEDTEIYEFEIEIISEEKINQN